LRVTGAPLPPPLSPQIPSENPGNSRSKTSQRSGNKEMGVIIITTPLQRHHNKTISPTLMLLTMLLLLLMMMTMMMVVVVVMPLFVHIFSKIPLEFTENMEFTAQ
jgi:hypothetical protein